MFKKIFQDTGILLFTQVFSKSAAFFYTVFLAVSLGVEGFGVYTFAFSVYALVSSISEFGISRYLMREVASGLNKAGFLLTQVVLLRLGFVFLSLLLFMILAYFINLGDLKKQLTLFMLLSAIPQSLALSIDSVFVGLRKVSISALGLFIVSITGTVLGICLLVLGFGIYGAVLAIVLSQIIYAIILSFIYIRQGHNLVFKVDLLVMKKALAGSLIYGLLGILGLLYFRIDAIMLSIIRGDYQTGLYGAAYRFLEAVLFIPAAINAVIFPVFVKLHDQGIDQVKKFYFKSLWLMVLFSTLITVLYILILPLVIQLFLPTFLPSITAIQILSLTIPFMFAHVPATLLLTSSEKYLKSVLIFSVLSVCLNIFLNLIFIPRYGFIGASIVTVFSEFASFIIFFTFLQIKVFKKS